MDGVDGEPLRGSFLDVSNMFIVDGDDSHLV